MVNVDVLYLGVSAAFYVNRDGTIGGTGRPGLRYVWRRMTLRPSRRPLP